MLKRTVLVVATVLLGFAFSQTAYAAGKVGSETGSGGQSDGNQTYTAWAQQHGVRTSGNGVGNTHPTRRSSATTYKMPACVWVPSWTPEEAKIWFEGGGGTSGIDSGGFASSDYASAARAAMIDNIPAGAQPYHLGENGKWWSKECADDNAGPAFQWVPQGMRGPRVDDLIGLLAQVAEDNLTIPDVVIGSSPNAV